MKQELIDAIVSALGWTLLHSLWQGALMIIVWKLAIRLFPRLTASSRYLVAVSCLFFMAIASAITFLWQFDPAGVATSTQFSGRTIDSLSSLTKSSPLAFSESIGGWISLRLKFFVLVWMTGTLIFALRFLISWWYALQLQRSLIPVDTFWENRFRELAFELGIRRPVLVAQSNAVNSPFLLGFFKPVVLLPLGMLSGLSPDQVEAILLHELGHIRRHDYFINLIQSVMEVIYFFNPFIWILSRTIRNERETCCDDIVVNRINPLIYARALQQLEEAKMPALALAAREKQNQLLTRIKRIMETRERKEVSIAKVLSVVIVIIALITTSWISVRAYLPDQRVDKIETSDPTAQDTTHKDLAKKQVSKESRSSSYSRKSITTVDENGEPHEEITEDFEGDEGLRELMEHQPEFEMADFAGDRWDNVINDSTGLMFPSFDGAFHDSFDTLPGPHFNFDQQFDWKEFSEKFTEEFREHFSDFYQKNRPAFEKMMQDINAQQKKTDEWMNNLNEMQAREIEKQMERSGAAFEQLQRLNKAQLFQEKAELMQLQAEKLHQLSSLDQSELMKEQAEKMKIVADNMKSLMKDFESALTELLIKDGYLEKTSSSKNINWSDTGIEVNGKKIKEKDVKKYEELHRKYFKKHNPFGHNE